MKTMINKPANRRTPGYPMFHKLVLLTCLILNDSICGQNVCNRQKVTEWHSEPQEITVKWSLTENYCLDFFTECWEMKKEDTNSDFSDIQMFPQICPLELQIGDRLFVSLSTSLKSYGMNLINVSRKAFVSCSKISYANNQLLFRSKVSSRHQVNPKWLGAGTHYFVEDSSQLCKMGLRLNVTIKEQHCQNLQDAPLCSGNGLCRTHAWEDSYSCHCNEHYTGKFCEEFDACSPKPCLNGATCLNRGGKKQQNEDYECTCSPQFTGFNCTEVIGQCEPHICLHGDCNHITPHSFQCVCDQNFTGPFCEEIKKSCNSQPCKNGGVCKDSWPEYICECPPGFTGHICDTKVDECMSYMCQNETTCINKANHVSCVCAAGVTDTRCEKQLRSCSSSPCLNDGSCVDQKNDYYCRCLQGFTGKNCEDIIDDCRLLSVNCLNEGLCLNIIGGYSCLCAPGWTGEFCQYVENACLIYPDRCRNGAPCIDTSQPKGRPQYECNCLPGFTGEHCETEINECISNPCRHGGTCSDFVGLYKCICPTGFQGVNCEVDLNACTFLNTSCPPDLLCVDLPIGLQYMCHSPCPEYLKPCANEGHCFIDETESYHCVCPPGWTGKNCLENINECEEHWCQNGATCEDDINKYRCICPDGFTGLFCETDIDDCIGNLCSEHGTCLDQLYNYTCRCMLGYEGHFCETEINECTSLLCENGATCVDLIGDFSCQCAIGFEGRKCSENIDDCWSTPCLNEGTCEDLINGFRCLCPLGYGGTDCSVDLDLCGMDLCQSHTTECTENEEGQNVICICEKGFTGHFCEININECDSGPCKNGAVCEDDVNRYLCFCPEGFEGLNCEINFDECSYGFCQNNSTCIDLVADYNCVCTPGFNDKNCSTNIDECVLDPCKNGATCYDLNGEYHCSCAQGFESKDCSVEVNECISNPCDPVGSLYCEDLVNSFRCACRLGYMGQQCEIPIRRCVDGLCQYGSKCDDLPGGFRCHCLSGLSGQFCEVNIDECQQGPCGALSICKDSLNTFHCFCAPGFIGNNCEIEVDECLSDPCQNGATCFDDLDAFSCLCPDGTEGNYCEININECHSSPCFHNATCVDFINGYECICLPGFTGVECEIDIDECVSSPCMNGATCIDQPGNYVCQCVAPFKEIISGSNCEFRPCEASNPCENGAVCVEEMELDTFPLGFRCQCAKGFAGPRCEINVNECISNPCINGYCYDVVSGFYCLCNPGFAGVRCDQDIDDCINHMCANNSTCVDLNLSYQCICLPGWKGEFCEQESNECDSNPCKNNATCTDLLNDYRCICALGWRGADCTQDVNECEPNPCLNGAKCIESAVPGKFECICPPFFTADLCKKQYDPCDMQYNPCINNSTCLTQINGTAACICRKGFEGIHCEIDTNECISSPCQNNGHCLDGTNGYSCECKIGFSGVHCEEDINECISSPCKNSGTCQDLVNRFQCHCTPGYFGSLCELDVNECEAQPCLHGGSCFNMPGGFQCVCPPGFSGIRCEININECASAPCLNNGRCIDGVNCYQCLCASGFMGSNCETNIDECASNPCLHGSCTDQVDGYLCDCEPGWTSLRCESNINECQSSPCLNRGLCYDLVNKYACFCPDGYKGKHCEIDIDICNESVQNSTLCFNGGTCVDGPATTFSCRCPNGFSGDFCEEEINECYSGPCFHGAICQDLVNGYRCHCRPGWTGLHCEYDINECQSEPCFHGICIEKDPGHGYTCFCHPGFVGRNCDHNYNDCLMHTCPIDYHCVDGINSITCIPTEITETTTWNSVINPTSVLPVFTNMEKSTYHAFQFSGTALLQNHQTVTLPVTDSISLISSIPDIKTEVNSNAVLSHGFPMTLSPASLTSTPTTFPPVEDREHLLAFSGLPEETRGLIEPSHIPISPSMLVTTRELDGFSFSPVHIARTEPPWLTHILDSISKSLDGDGTHREDFKTSQKQPFGTPLTSCEICSASTLSEDHFSKRPLLESSANETFKISGMFMSTTDWITTYFKISPFSDQFSLNAEISQSEYISSQLLYSGITSHRISITGKMPQPEAYFSTFIKSVLSMPIDTDVDMSNEVHPTVTDVYLLSTDLANAFPLGLDLAKENVFSSEPRIQLSQTVLPFPEQSFLDTFTQFSGTHDVPLKTMESGTSETIDNVMYSSGSKDGNLSSSGQLHWTSTDPFQKGQMSESSAYFSRSQTVSSMDTGHAPNLLDTDTNVSYVHYHGNSFLVFEGISLHAQNNISVRFQSQNPEGTLLYADQGQTAADFFFFKLFIEHGNLQYIFSCKHEERIQSINTTIRVDDGKEYTVYIRQYLTPCEAEVTVSGSPTVRSMPSNNWSGLTNQKTGPLFIGGLPLSYWPNQAAEPIYNFTGCIEVIEINKLSRLFPSNAVGSNNINNCRFSWHKVMPTASMTSRLALINFTPAIIKMPTSALIPTPTAPLPVSACQEALCQNGGTCRHVMLQSGATSFQCDCPLHFTGHFCEKDTTLFFPSFNGESYLELPSLTSLVESTDSKVTLSQDTENTVTLYLTVKTSTSHGTILYTREENFGERFLHMLIVDGKPLVKLGCGGFKVLTVWANENINSDRLTPITVQYQLPVGSYGGHCMIEVAVNNNVPSKQKEYLSHRVFEAKFGPVFIGNIPSHSELYDGAEKVIGFQGCIRELQMNTKELFIVDEAVRGKNIENCNAPVCQYHPCRNEGVCVSDAENWFCKCPDLYSGKLCQFTACERSPCGHGATCVPKTDQDTVCLCPYGRTGLLCNEAVNVTRPRFSGTDEFGSTSFLAYFTIHNMSFYFEFQLKFTLANNRSAVKDNLIIFTGQKGQGLNGDDFLALGLRKGRIVYKFNLGSGVATILSKPLNLARDIHIIHFGRSLKTGWLKVDDQRNKTGSSPGQLVGLNVFSQFYVGGYNEYTPELLPAGSHFSNGFQGCIFDLQVQTIRNGRFRAPGKPEGHPSAGRSVGQCEDTPCSLVQCKNGGTCIARGSTVYCKCPLEWKGALCTETVSVCDAEHAPPPRCAQGSTCVPIPYGYTCQCPLGTTGMYCEQSLRISDPFFSSNESSWMSFTPFNIRHRTHLRMQFKSLSPDGMLFYTAQHLSPRSGDFFSVSLTHGFVQLRYNLGDKTVILQASDRVDASGKTWHLVHAGRKGNEGYLALDGKTVTQNLTVGMTALDATTDFYVGGVSSLNAISSNAVEDEPVSFTGCIREVIINERELQLTESGAHSGANVGDWDGTACGYKVCKNHGSCNLNRFKQFTCTCPPLWTGSTCAVSVFCADHLCQHHSLCIPNILTASYSCACSLGWEGKYCEKHVSFLTARFAGNSYIKYTDPYYETRNLKFTKVSVNFTSNASEALILWMGTAEDEDDDYLAVGLHNGKLKVAFNLGERISVPLTYNKTLLCCNKWHSVTVIQNRTVIKVYLDDEMVLFEDLDPFERYVALNYGGICYLGGFELHRDITSLTSALFTQGLIGKVKDVILFQDSKNIQFLQSSEGYNVYSGDN